MKLIPLIFLTAFISNSSLATSAGEFSEEIYVSDLSSLKIIKNHPELIIDHVSDYGFELFGPKGTSQWLDDLKISYSVESEHSHAKKIDDAGYPSFEKIESFLKEIVSKRPDIAKLISIGKSVEGRDLWAVKISDNVALDEVEPEFKYISSMHGNEITGRELTQFLIKDLIEGYGKDSKITELINNTEIFIMPSMNPDGSESRQRANAKGYDLNRNFPDWVRGDLNTSSKRQPETIAIMKFQKERNFSLSANFHGGAVVVNYPWDNTYDRHPFTKLIKDISLRYSGLNPEMRNSRQFSGGITNGADWYVLKGGMQDWSYFWYNDLQVTIELSSNKWPSYSQIPNYYKNNRDSMLGYLESIHQGAGFKIEKSLSSGRVHILQNLSDGTIEDKGSYGFTRGEFYKVLPEGNYTFNIQKEGSDLIKKINIDVENKIKVDGGFSSVIL